MSDRLLYDEQTRDHFHRLPHDEQASAVRNLARDGFGDHEIAARTGLHVNQVRALLGKREARP